MTDMVIHEGGSTAETRPERNGNVVNPYPRQGRGAATAPVAHRLGVQTRHDAEHPAVCGTFESTEMIWLKTPQRLPGAMLTVVFATSGRSMVVHAGSSHSWFAIGWDGDRLRVGGPVQRSDDTTTPLFSIALVWFERFLLSGPRLITEDHGITLAGSSSQVSFTPVHAPSKWCVVDRARLQC